MATDSAAVSRDLPIVCTLTPEERVERSDTLADLFGAAVQVEDLTDGYAFHYPGTEEWARRLVEFVVFERRCCRFFTFDLHFAPDEGPIHLRVRGPAGVKEMLVTGTAPWPSA